MRTATPLAAFWFLYFGGLGIFVPYYGLYLKENAGLGGTEVGAVLAILPLVGLLSQTIWGQIADRTGSRGAVLTLLTVGAALGCAALSVASGFVPLLIATAFMALFSSAVLPLSVSISFAALRDRGPHAFGLLRVWGTIGFLVCVVAFPSALHFVQDRRGLVRDPTGVSEPGLELMFPATAVLVLAAAAVGPLLPRSGAVGLRASRGEWRELIRSAPLRRLLLVTLVAYLFLQGPMGLFPVYVRALGGDMDTVGRMWAVMAVVEIPMIALSGTGLKRIGARGLLAVGVLTGGLRWLLCGISQDLSILYAVQFLHGILVSGLMLGGPLYLEAFVPERLRSTGQALLATVGVGCGGALSNIGSGWLLEHAGARAPYVVGGVGAIVLGLALPWLLPSAPQPVKELAGEVD